MSLNIRRFVTGIQLKPVPTVTIDTAGELSFSTSTNQFYGHNGTSALPLATTSGVETFTNKTLTSPIINTATADTITGISGGSLTLQSASNQNLVLQAQGTGVASLLGTTVTVKDSVFDVGSITGGAGNPFTVQGASNQLATFQSQGTGDVHIYAGSGIVKVVNSIFQPNSLTGNPGADYAVRSETNQNLNLVAQGTGSINLEPGSGFAYVSNELRINGSSSGYVGFKTTTAPTSYTVVMPGAQGGASTFLQNDGSGNLSWVAGATGANTSLSNLSSVAINTSLLPGTNDNLNLGDTTHRWNGLQTNSISLFNASSTSIGTIQSNGLTMPDGTNTANLGIRSANPNTIGIMTDSNASTTVNSSSIFIETGNNTSATGSYSTGSILLRTGAKSSGSATRGKIQFQDGSEGTSGQVWTSSDTVGSGGWAAATSQFQFYVSSKVITDSTGITANTYTTFSNSPAFSFTPTVTGKYKIYCSMGVESGTVNFSSIKVANTAGSATVVAESECQTFGGASGYDWGMFVQSVYTLTSGTSYTFDIQGKAGASSTIYCLAANGPFYMFGELCG